MKIPEYVSQNYIQDEINRTIKNKIEFMFHCIYERKPTYEEYHEWFDKFIKNAECTVVNADIGIYDEDSSKWFEAVRIDL